MLGGRTRSTSGGGNNSTSEREGGAYSSVNIDDDNQFSIDDEGLDNDGVGINGIQFLLVPDKSWYSFLGIMKAAKLAV